MKAYGLLCTGRIFRQGVGTSSLITGIHHLRAQQETTPNAILVTVILYRNYLVKQNR
jgi:hypothetical protein